MEKSLAKKSTLAEEFNEEIRVMIERGSAVPLSKEVLDNWNGDYYYLPIFGVQGKKSEFVSMPHASNVDANR